MTSALSWATWAKQDTPDVKDYNTLCSELKASDLVMHCYSDEDGTHVAITPKAYFEADGVMLSPTLMLPAGTLPDDLQNNQEEEGMFATARPLPEVRQELLAFGLQETPAFSALIISSIDPPPAVPAPSISTFSATVVCKKKCKRS